jgi:NAD(P)-dependent dehydrogenase (short-subunit alcohol dehydrogenase family)
VSNLSHNKHNKPQAGKTEQKKMKAALDKKRFGPWALVTGASSGIGREFVRRIAASGIHVALVGRREHLLRKVGAECTGASGVQHRIIPLDLSEPDFLPVLADATRDLDIGLVVSNAGPLKPMTVEQCVSEGLSGLIKNRSRVVPGRLNRIMNALVPPSLARKLEADLLGKGIASKAASANSRAEV